MAAAARPSGLLFPVPDSRIPSAAQPPIVAACWQALTWALGAVAFLAPGVRLASRPTRFTSLAAIAIGLLLGVRAYAEGRSLYFNAADSALLFYDISHLEPKYRLVSSAILGLQYLAATLINQRAERQLAAQEGRSPANGTAEDL